MQRQFNLRVNGTAHAVMSDADRPLLSVLREDLGLTGTKYGCGEGECGACTVLIDGKAVRSCITSLGELDNGQITGQITTIEGLAHHGALHAVQQAFLDQQAMQCGYCVPGQILTAVALVNANPHATRDEIIAAMRGNLCRCCNYPAILSAVEQAATTTGGAPATR